jgi:putative aldouronate transport system substrate-binding protein
MKKRVMLHVLLVLFLAVGICSWAQQAKTYGTHLKISYASIQTAAGVDYNTADDFTKYFLNKFNIEWDVIPLTWENWAERLRVWINSGDMPDLATWNYVHGEAISYIDQGLFRRFPNDWKQRWPNVAKAYTDSELGPTVEKLVGGTFFLPKPIYSTHKPIDPLATHLSLVMRKDWMKAIDFPVKDSYTVNELLSYARQVKQRDPGKVGTKLFPMNMRPLFAAPAFVRSAFEYYDTFYKGSDGKYRWGPAANETLAGLKWYEKAYSEGLLNPEFFALKQTEDYDSFYMTGRTAAFFGEGLPPAINRYQQAVTQYLNLDPKNVVQIATLLGEDGKYHEREAINFWTASIFSPKMAAEKFERIMDLMDYVATNEGQLIVRMGFEGKDYKLLAGGEIQPLFPSTTNIMKIYPTLHPIYGNMVILSDDFSVVNPAIEKYWRDRVAAMYAVKQKFGTTSRPRTDWKVFFHDSPMLRKVPTTANLNDEFARLVTDKGDMETKWRNWVSEKMPIVQVVLDELNKK